MKFKKLTKADKPIFDKFYLARYYESAQYTFTNLFMWREMLNLQWAMEDEIIFTITEWKDQIAIWQPIGAKEKMFVAIEKILRHFKNSDKEVLFVGLEKNFVEDLENYPHAKFKIESDRDNFDYVYLAQDLINLSGRKYHGKKNHLNAFRSQYPSAQYVSDFTDEVKNLCVELLNVWYSEHDLNEYPALPFELGAILELLDDFDFFDIKGGAILLGKKVVAFSIGERLNDDTAVIHIEKADFDIKGAYASINRQFAAFEWKDLKYINREEDLGISGIRSAKESYNPVKMIEKFHVKLK